jgi:hypothetical protein
MKEYHKLLLKFTKTLTLFIIVFALGVLLSMIKLNLPLAFSFCVGLISLLAILILVNIKIHKIENILFDDYKVVSEINKYEIKANDKCEIMIDDEKYILYRLSTNHYSKGICLIKDNHEPNYAVKAFYSKEIEKMIEIDPGMFFNSVNNLSINLIPVKNEIN